MRRQRVELLTLAASVMRVNSWHVPRMMSFGTHRPGKSPNSLLSDLNLTPSTKFSSAWLGRCSFPSPGARASLGDFKLLVVRLLIQGHL